jgi:serine/threonine-protein kinase
MNQAAQTPATQSNPVPTVQAPDLSGKTLGEFQLIRRLGQGGMGQVYLAQQLTLKRKVAIKIMRPEMAADATSFQRFKSEAEAIARITHANIVQVYAFNEQDGLHYMAMEYVEGRNLGEYVARKGPPDVPLALSIMRQVAAALQRAAELGIIHRDIKPDNILLTRRGEVKVADFGLSRCLAGDRPSPQLTQTGMTMGTPLYMSPEQIQGQPLDPRTDIYSFGITCFQMLTGRPPFQGQTAFDLAMQHIQTEPTPLHSLRPDLPVDLCAIIHKMMAKELEKRYPTGGELLKDLNRCRENWAAQKTQASVEAVSALPTGQVPSTIQMAVPVSGRRWLLALAAGSVLLSLAAGGLAASLRNRAPAATEPPLATVEPQLSSMKKHEQFLRQAVAEYANPGSDPKQLQFGMLHRVELLVYYLEQQQLKEAEQFAGELMKNAYNVDGYKYLGRLGKAIVLARQNKAEDSNREFLDLLAEPPRSSKAVQSRLAFVRRQPGLMREIALALDYNKANATTEHPFPPPLEPWRQPLAVLRRGVTDKPREKSP